MKLSSIMPGRFRKKIAIDLGNNTIRILESGRGILFQEPTVIALKGLGTDREEIIAVGHKAKQMIGKGHKNLAVIRPMRAGVIDDYNMVDKIMQHCIKLCVKRSLFAPDILIGMPLGTTPVERRAVRDTAQRLGIKHIGALEEPIAAAIGVGLPLEMPTASMIIELGGGTTEIAILSLNGIVLFNSVRLGGDTLDDTIASYVKEKFKLTISSSEAENAKIQVGAALKGVVPVSHAVRGMDLISGLPRSIGITSADIFESIDAQLGAIDQAIRDVLDKCPPELSSDLLTNGIMLTGGVAQLRGIDTRIAALTGLPVTIADDPANAVIRGLGICLDSFEDYAELVSM